MRTLRLFVRIMDKLSEWIGLLTSVLLPAMVTVLTYEIVSRYVFAKPTVWAFDTAIFMFGYCGLLSGAYILREKEHINVDVFYNRLSPRKRAILDSITSFLLFFFIILVIIYGWKSAISSIVMGEHTRTEWAAPVGHFKLMLPIGGLLLFLQGIANWIRSIYRAVTDKEFNA